MPSLTIQVGSSCVCKQDRQERSVPSLGIHSRCSAARWCVRRTGSGAGRFLLRAHPTASAPAHTSAHDSHLRCPSSANQHIYFNVVFVSIDAERCNLFFSYSFSSQILSRYTTSRPAALAHTQTLCTLITHMFNSSQTPELQARGARKLRRRVWSIAK